MPADDEAGGQVLGEQGVSRQILQLDDHVMAARIDVGLSELLPPG